MKLQKLPHKLLTGSILAATAVSAPAFEVEHEAHQHGHAELTIVIEGQQLALELHSPAINIVGFEHRAANHEQQHAIENAERQLKQASIFFVFNDAAACQLSSVAVESTLLAHDDDHHEDEHHDEHKAHHDDEHHDEHDAHDSEAESHSEFEAAYRYQCDNIQQLRTLNVKLFEQFPTLEELDVQLAGPDGQKLITLRKDQTLVAF